MRDGLGLGWGRAGGDAAYTELPGLLGSPGMHLRIPALTMALTLRLLWAQADLGDR